MRKNAGNFFAVEIGQFLREVPRAGQGGESRSAAARAPAGCTEVTRKPGAQTCRPKLGLEAGRGGARAWATSLQPAVQVPPGTRGSRQRTSAASCSKCFDKILSIFLSKFQQNFACFRLYRHLSLQVDTRFSGCYKIYRI